MDENELIEREKTLAAREKALTQRIVRIELASALSEAKCRPEALQDAAALLAAGAEITLAEDGMTIASVSVAGESTGVAAAARRFLAGRPFLAAADEPAPRTAPTTTTAAQASAMVASAFSTTPAAKPKPAPAVAPTSAHDLVQRGWLETPE